MQLQKQCVTVFFLLLVILFVPVHGAHAATAVGGDITTNAEWRLSGSPYVLTSQVHVLPGATLTIDPGVTVSNANHVPLALNIGISVNGGLVSSGTAEQRVEINDFFISGSGASFAISYTDMLRLGTLMHSSVTLAHSTLSSISVQAASSVVADDVIIEASLYVPEPDMPSLADVSCTFFMQNSRIRNDAPNGKALIIEDNTFATLKNVVVSAGLIGISMTVDSSLDGDHLVVRHASQAGIYMQKHPDEPWDNNRIKLRASEIAANGNGIEIHSTPVLIDVSGNSFHNNSLAVAHTDNVVQFHFENNWWGDAAGPLNAVSNNVLVSPWLTTSPVVPAPEDPPLPVTGYSSVLFIPGFEGSRLYKTRLLTNSEDQLWEPNNNADVADLAMDTSGSSSDASIYTRDIIGKTNIFSLSDINIYKSFEERLDSMVASKSITAWAAAPYDWRYDPKYVVDHGTLDSSGHVTYETAVPDGQRPFIISQLEALIASSKTGKVTIVTHSNGGLVVKALVEKLQAMHDAGQNNDIAKIDKIIMVAAPQLGTPQVIAAMLHGDGTELGAGFVLSEATARDFGKNVPGAYTLLPSQKYMDMATSPVVTFDPSIDAISNFHAVYGNSITTYSALKNFLTGSLDGRTNPDRSDTISPIRLNTTLLNNADATHSDIDNYQFPSNIHVYQLAGWGEPTASGVAYRVQTKCEHGTCVPRLDEKLIPTDDGDEKVLTPSALFGTGTKYYLNLKDYNNYYNINLDHKEILEMATAQEFIQNIITNNSALPDFVTADKPSGSDNLVLSTHSPVTLDIYDAQGRHTGLAPTQSIPDFQQVDEQIPNSSYMPFGEGTYVSVPTGGSYSVNIAGTDFGTFTFEKEHYVNDQAQTADMATFADIPVTPMTNAMLTVDAQGAPSQIRLDIDGDGTVDQTLAPGADFDPIQYLEMMKKVITSMQLATNVENALIKKVNKLETAVQSGKIKDAKTKLKAILKSVKTTRGNKKKIDVADKQTLTDMFNKLLDNLN